MLSFPFFQISKKTLEEAIKSEFSGSIEDGLLAIGKNALTFLSMQTDVGEGLSKTSS